MKFVEVEVRRNLDVNIHHYDVEVEKNFTVEEFAEAVITEPANFAARGAFQFIEVENRTEVRLCDCEKEDAYAWYQMASIYGGFPIPKQYLKRDIGKIEANGYGLGCYNPAISYLLLLKKETCYYETEKGQLSLFPVKTSKKRKEKR